MNCSAIEREVWPIGLVLCGILSSCAVLTVDVDVYKGALVNDEHVQLHQLVALTTAAQPMLVHLRDNLEWPETEGKPPQGTMSCAPESNKGGRDESWYVKGHVREPVGWVAEAPKSWWQQLKEWISSSKASCQPNFRNVYAGAVNSVLGLYDDLGDPELAPHGRKLRQAVERLQRARADTKHDQVIYDQIASAFRAESNLGAGLKNLKEGYREFLISSTREESSRRVGKLMDAFKALAQDDRKQKEGNNTPIPNELESDLLQEWRKTDVYKEQNKIFDRRLPFRVVWKFLGEGDLEETLFARLTKQLCLKEPAGDTACAELLKRTGKLAAEYWDTRKAIREVWEEGLGLLLDIDRLQQDKPGRYRALKEKVLTLVIQVTNVRHIASALDRLDEDGRCSILRNGLAPGSMCEAGSDGNLVWAEEKVRDNIEYFEGELGRALSIAPADTVPFLLHLDSLEKTVPQKNGIANDLVEKANKINANRIVKLGLNRSFIDDNKLNNSQEVFSIVDDVSRYLAQGFERGRLPEGLNTLTEAFLKSHDGNTGEGATQDEQRLLDGLVEFAQKILFLANHEGLASSTGTQGVLLGGAEKLSRGLLGDDLTDISIYRFSSTLAEAKKQQYVRVLQAVGNSILFSANELRERNRYRESSEKNVRAEVAAANSIYSPTPRSVIEDLVRELLHDKEQAKKRLDEATTRKNTLIAQVGKEKPPTGAYASLDNVSAEVEVAKKNLDSYRNNTPPVDALLQILTEETSGSFKAQWRAAGKEASDLDDFLSGADGLKTKIQTRRTARDGSLTPDETRLFEDSLKYVGDSETRMAFAAHRIEKGHTTKKFDVLLDEFIVYISQLNSLHGERLKQYEKVRDEKKQRQQEIESSIARLSKEVKDLELLFLQLPMEIERLQTASEVLVEMKVDVVTDAEKTRPFVLPNAVYTLITQHVDKKKTTLGQEKRYEDALEVFSRRTPPPGMAPLNPSSYKSPLAVMDEVIALLRHQQMKMVKSFGPDSEEDKRATAALENAYQHRAGMIYIRPSSAYLRTSFPSTSLQDDPNLAWDNMLLKQGIRNLPFSSQVRDILDPSENQNRVLTADLDKQYWQNINRVRVSGTGLTNQVLAKDDVGNWYVKQYYGDTKDIVKSAKNLALYSLGTKLPIDLSHQLGLISAPQDGSKKSDWEKDADSTPLQKIFGKHRSAYYAHTTKMSTKLVGMHAKGEDKTIHNQIIVAWERVDGLKNDTDLMKALRAALDEEITEWDKTAEPLKKASDQERGLAMAKDLQALAKLDRALSARIRQIDKPEALKVKAAGEVHNVVGPAVLDALEDHKLALDRFEEAILFIGDAINPDDQKEDQVK